MQIQVHMWQLVVKAVELTRESNSDGELQHLTETAACRYPPLQRRLHLLHLHQVVVVAGQVKVVLDEPLEGGDLLQRPAADLRLGGGRAGVGAEAARVARLPRAGG